MQEKDIYNAKKELAKLYLILKTENIEGVINIKNNIIIITILFYYLFRKKLVILKEKI